MKLRFEHLISATGFILLSCSLEPSGGINLRTQNSQPASKDAKPIVENKSEDSCDTKSDEDTLLTGKEIIDKKCVVCHGPGQSSPDLSSRDKIVAAKKEVIRSVVDGSMPPSGPLPKAEVDLFKTWGEQPDTYLALAGPDAEYVDGIRPLFNSKCSFCHSPNGFTPRGPFLDTLVRARNRADASHAEMQSGDMPPTNPYVSASSADTALIAEWIQKGKPEGNLPVYPSEIGFTTHVKPFVVANCLSCHSAGKAAPALDNDDQIKAAANSILGSLERKTMPPGGHIYTTEIEMIRNWITQTAARPPQVTPTTTKPACK